MLSVCGVNPSWIFLYTVVLDSGFVIGSLSHRVTFKARPLCPPNKGRVSMTHEAFPCGPSGLSQSYSPTYFSSLFTQPPLCSSHIVQFLFTAGLLLNTASRLLLIFILLPGLSFPSSIPFLTELPFPLLLSGFRSALPAGPVQPGLRLGSVSSDESFDPGSVSFTS